MVACRVRYQSFFLPSLRQFRLPLLASSLPFSLPLPYSTDSQIPRRQTTKTAREGGRGGVKKEGRYTASLPAPAPPVSTPTIVLGVRVPKIIYYVRKNLFVGRHRYRLRRRRGSRSSSESDYITPSLIPTRPSAQSHFLLTQRYFSISQIFHGHGASCAPVGRPFGSLGSRFGTVAPYRLCFCLLSICEMVESLAKDSTTLKARLEKRARTLQ